MPQGLVAVTGEASRRHAPRRAGPARRRLRRPLVGVTLVIAAIVTPVESAILPERLEDLAPDAPASAQSPPPPPAIRDGVSEDCPQTPVPWEDDDGDGECVLETDNACPPSPVASSTTSMLPSLGQPDDAQDIDGQRLLRYPGFCEQRIFESDELSAYGACTAVTGFVVMIHPIEEVPEDPNDPNSALVTKNMCRLIHPSVCTVGQKVDTNTCRAVKRRTWTCTSGIPRNAFNTCYVEPTGTVGTAHPACDPDQGAPTLVALSCEIYVGQDYARAPASVDCVGFDTGNTAPAMSRNTLTGTSSDYWCEFDPRYLKVVCHGNSPPAAVCGASTARCLKRASETGGCNAIAKTIRCRSLQAGSLTADALRAEGCEPCILLPFQADSDDCPDDLTGTPMIFSTFIGRQYALEGSRYGIWERRYDNIHRQRRDIPLAGKVCPDPPTGVLSWRSSHLSELAVVNSPVVFTVHDVPIEQSGSVPVLLSSTRTGLDFRTKWTFIQYASPTDEDPMIRTWIGASSGASLSSVRDMVRSGECALTNTPRIRVRIEELWPDNAQTEIEDLFGADALAWWRDLPDDTVRKHRTEARDLEYWGNLDAAGKIRETQRRSRDLTETILCNLVEQIWCRWVPTRSGYFKVQAVGAWISRFYSSGRDWYSISDVDQELSSGKFGSGLNLTALSRRGLSPEQAGLSSGLTSALPLPSASDDWLYSAEAGSNFRCPGPDVRVRCHAGGDASNYTESEPIGIQVFEMRVATRLPRLPNT